MMNIDYSSDFQSLIRKIKNKDELDKVKKHIHKIVLNPEIGKPMKFGRKGTREVYIGSFRLSYAYLPEENKIILLDLYHKDEQ